MGVIDGIMLKFEEVKRKIVGYNSWKNRYERLKNSDSNQRARKNYLKIISNMSEDQQLSEEQEAILYSQAFHQLYLKNPAVARFPELDEYEVKKLEETYIVKGYCDSTNSYGAQIREKHEYEVYKNNGEWTCVTDLKARVWKWVILWLLFIALISIITSCSAFASLSAY